MSRLEEISQYINQLLFDLRAELLVAVLAEQRIDLNEVLASLDGQLKRVWSSDIAWSAADSLETGDNKLILHLNRDGIYDVLPEAIFHSSAEDKDKTGQGMAKDSKILKSEEKDARTFFQPFENEIFLQRVQLTMTENRLFKNIHTNFLMGLIPDFWRIDHDLPEDYVSRLKKLLPLAHQITGDSELTAQCLEFILREKVQIEGTDEDDYSTDQNDYSCSGIMGTCILGVDMICGSIPDFYIKRYICSIGPISSSEAIEYVKDGKMNRFLDCFYGYFIPFELDMETKYIFGRAQSNFILNENIDVQISYLGYNSVIE